MLVWLPSCMCTTPSTRGLITPSLSCQLRNTQVLRLPSRAEAGKSRQPFVPAERCVPHYGNLLLSNLLPMRPWDVQQLLTLILKLKPSFLQHVMLGHLDHDRTCISNSKCYMLSSCRFSSSQKPLLQRTKSHTVAVVLPAHWALCVWDGSALAWATVHLHCLCHTWITWCPAWGIRCLPCMPVPAELVCWAPRLTLTGTSGCTYWRLVRGWTQTCTHLHQQQSPHRITP